MGYTKAWIPPSKAIASNLASWKAICQDIHDNLVLSGLAVTGDTGQLDISTVSVYPTSGTFAGYKMYKVDDGNALPIYIKLEFGAGRTGNNSYSNTAVDNTIRIKVTIGTATNGAGSITGNSVTYQYPQNDDTTSASGSSVSASKFGFSFICNNSDRGFLGVAYQVAGRDESYLVSPTFATLVSSTLGIFIQRDYSDETGLPTSDGFMVLYPEIPSVYTSANFFTYSGALPVSKSVYFKADGSISQPSVQISRTLQSPYGLGTSFDHPACTMNLGRVREMTCLGVSKLGTAAEGTIVNAKVGDTFQSMVSIGRETSLSFIPEYQRHCTFMLWE